MLKRIKILSFNLLSIGFLLLSCSFVKADSIPSAKQPLILMDMVHNNPGEEPTQSKFTDPLFLKQQGYNAKVFFLFEAAQFGINWKIFDPAIFPDTSAAAKWVIEKDNVLQKKYSAAKAAGLNVYCMLDMLVLPAALMQQHKAELCNTDGKIDISKPFTQQCIRSLINQMFDHYPQLDGLVIRTGETYLHDAPFYVGNHPVVHDMNDHVTLINILRDEVCVKRNKKLFYRTWDDGKLHSLPKYYLAITNKIEPHPNLFFSVKHTMVDFWRAAITIAPGRINTFDKYWIDEASKYGVPFNPCIGIGKHKQIIEVQCQREYEGKAAHVNYIAKGVIDGFDELKNSAIPHSLNQIKNNPLFAGLWTWSRGGGWGGPYVVNEIWPELNAYVLAQWTQHPDKTEQEIFHAFAKEKGLSENEIESFHKLCLLSSDGIMKSQYSKMGGVFVNWTRDDNITGLFFLKNYFDTIIKSGKQNLYLKEKEEGAAIWKEISVLSKKLHFKDTSLTNFVRASCEYARLKFEFFSTAWNVMLTGYATEKNGANDQQKVNQYIIVYDKALKEWSDFVKNNPMSPTMYKVSSTFFNNQTGIAETVDKFRDISK